MCLKPLAPLLYGGEGVVKHIRCTYYNLILVHTSWLEYSPTHFPDTTKYTSIYLLRTQNQNVQTFLTPECIELTKHFKIINQSETSSSYKYHMLATNTLHSQLKPHTFGIFPISIPTNRFPTTSSKISKSNINCNLKHHLSTHTRSTHQISSH